ncbi:hypothetical protein E4T46_04304 [Aureobasidium subglaciale]|nr:hypothetical protein E4T41_04418 [Aureobasidium subglaciale]KAI5262559.1 hypothetical protein E4T46_04304 [Aureobasidium subglaciale]
MSTLQEEADLGEFFDFQNAVSDGSSMQTSSAIADPDHISHTYNDNNDNNEATLTIFENEAAEAADYSNFSRWIPRFIQPDGPCTYCRDRKLNCYLSYGKVTCTACDTLFRPCSFVKPHSHAAPEVPEGESSMGFVDTLHPVIEDCCQEQGKLTGVRSLKSMPDKKSSSRFSKAALKVLRGWLDEHQANPYPTEDEKEQLSRTTGLRVPQINTWLANARRRGKAGVKNKAAMDGLLQSTTTSLPPTAAIGIPGATEIEINKWSDMNPLERWKHSPPQNEPAPFNAIADALDRKDLPDYAEESSSPSTLGWQGLGSSRDDSRSSNRRAASVTSLEKSTSNSAASSAAWSGSRDSWGSYSSFGSSLNGRKERRRRRKMPGTTLKKPSNDKSLQKERLYQCTFCTDTFLTKYDWVRHEKTLHLSLEKWICCPLGPETLDSASGQTICAYCCELEPTKDHIESHNHRQCLDKGFQGRTFYRKDHLRQHLRLVHESKLLPHMEAWKTSLTNVNSKCGFCYQRFTVWSERNDHLAIHFKNGAKMSEWKGCRGLDPAVAALVTSAMPPYLIGIETNSVNPFTATNPMRCMTVQAHLESGGAPATCWEILTVRLGRFAKEQTDKGVVLTDEMLQTQARRILYDSDDAWDNTAADNPEWLDLFKRAHALDYIPSEVSGIGKNVPEDLEIYTDLGMRIPLSVQAARGMSLEYPPVGLPTVQGPLEASRSTMQQEPTGATNIACTRWLLPSSRSSLSQPSPQWGSELATPATYQSQGSTPLQLDTPHDLNLDNCFDADIDAILAEAGYQAPSEAHAGDLARQQNAMLAQQHGLDASFTPRKAQQQLAEMNAAMAVLTEQAVLCDVPTSGQSTSTLDYSTFGMETDLSNLINSTATSSSDNLFATTWDGKDQFGLDNAFTAAAAEAGYTATDMTMQDLDMNDIQFGDMDFTRLEQQAWLYSHYAVPRTYQAREQRIDYFLKQTYLNSSKMDCQPYLLLITSPDDLNPTDHAHATQPLVKSFSSPFLDKSLEEAADMLQEIIRTSKFDIVESNLFAVLDDQSLSLDSGLIVQVKDGVVDFVRVHFDTINAELMRIWIVTRDIKETKWLVGDDGVFRTKPPEESQKGRPAPRKKLG